MKLKLFLITLIFITQIVAQEKPDSTFLRYHLKEFKQWQKIYSSYDSSRFRAKTLMEYNYSKIIEEQNKINKKLQKQKKGTK